MQDRLLAPPAKTPSEQRTGIRSPSDLWSEKEAEEEWV